MSKKTVKVVVGAYASGDDMDGPSYAVIRVTPILFERIAEMIQACENHALSEVRTLHCVAWGPGDVREDLSLQNGELVVLPGGSFWFRDQPKHSDGHIETRAATVFELRDAYDSAEHDAIAFLNDSDGAVEDRYREFNDLDDENGPAESREAAA